MTTEPTVEPAASGTGQPDPPTTRDGRQAIERDIEQTREQLGQTVEALAAKADVKRIGKQKYHAARQQASDQPVKLAAIAGSALALAVVVVLWRRSR